ncbi:uncharacterized protein METZ01_LOCUS150293 [marine metagenome]|uniref:Uncharacterized protein n=1 Tax=marine metagenome TaxID=408172 RepID=A0A382A7U7_9ZZZZ
MLYYGVIYGIRSCGALKEGIYDPFKG